MRPPADRSFTRVASAMIVFAVALSGCGGPPETQAPTAEPIATLESPTAPPTAQPTLIPPIPTPTIVTTPTKADIKAGIQKTLDRYVKAYNDNDPDLFLETIDPTNLPFRRYVRAHFDNAHLSFLADHRMARLLARAVTPREQGFMLAHIETRSGSAADWLFRQYKGRWVLSEPTVEQIGKRKETKSEHFVFYSYPWADDVTPTLIKLMEQARENVIKRLGKAPDQKTYVVIQPIYGLNKFASATFIARYFSSGRPGVADTIQMYAPHGYVFGFYDADESWEPELERTLTHEYTHLVHDRSFPDAGKASIWMSEGLAEYVAGNSREWEVREAVRTGNIIPIVDSVSPVYKQDLQHIDTLVKDTSLAYGLSYSLVAYIDEKHGGLKGFWKLARAYTESQNLDVALDEAFGVSYEKFDRGWRDWLEETYK